MSYFSSIIYAIGIWFISWIDYMKTYLNDPFPIAVVLS